MKSFLKAFQKDEGGYVLVLSLILLPVFLGFGLLIIDVGRGNNAHADLQAAADAVALAGARELDGTADAITRAETAMAQLTNNVSMLARQGAGVEIELVYENTAGNEFSVRFLRGIPGSTPQGEPNAIPGDDTTPINAAFLTTWGTADPALAEYVYVYAQSENLETAFFNPASLLPSSVPVSATAVAKTVSAVCDFTPVYICNPFENTAGYSGDGLQTRFDNGDLHGRMIRLHPKGNGTHTPGNFGFLQVEAANGTQSASAAALRSVFAGRRPGSCFAAGDVTTKTGGAVAVAQGINVKFGIFAGPFSGNNNNLGYTVATAPNVRKGHVPQGNSCNGTAGDDHFLEPIAEHTPVQLWNGPEPNNGSNSLEGVMGLPDNYNMEIVSTTDAGTTIPGAIVGWGDWPINLYLERNYGSSYSNWTTVLGLDAFDSSGPNGFNLTGTASMSDPGARMPSRYDVYRWELANPTILATASPGGEDGLPCNSATVVTDPDPRLIYAAIVDCQSAVAVAQGGGINTYPVNTYAEIFLTRPMGSNGRGNNAQAVNYTDPVTGEVYEGYDATIDVEIVRVTGAGGNGVLENFIRNESILVR